MKSFIQLEYSENSLGLMPCRIKNQKSLPKVDISKDLNLNLVETECRDNQGRSLLALNLGIYNLKNTYKDKKKIKDAVTVKKMNLLCKENVENKRMPMLINFVKRNSLNFSGGIQYHRKSCQKSPLKIFSKKLSETNDMQYGPRTFTSPTSPAVIHDRKALKLQKLQKQNEFNQSIFETKHLQANSKSEALINTKLKSYINTIKQGRKLHNMSQEINKQAKKKSLRVRIKRGNNSQLIKWLFKKRWWWTIEDDKQTKSKTNFIWSQLKEKNFFQNQNTQQHTQIQTLPQITCHNHFPQNQYLGNKKALFYNMSYYYKTKGIDVFDKLPLTYHIASLDDQSWRDFTSKYQQLKKSGQNNIWILKPGENSNRGRGITVHQSYQQMKSIVGSGQTFIDHHDSKVKQRTYIIQLYIDKPFLYNKRKFDIRCYMLLVNINNSVKGYWYSQGYIRTSSFQFQLNDFNTFVHLTNDAIQNHSQNYGKYQDGNKVSYAQFQRYLDLKFVGCGYDLQKQIIPKMKQIATDSMKAAIHLVKGEKQQKPVFEIFGLDFMIDKNFRPWLIEINTNPCIETTCLVLEKVIPRMLDDALKLSLDLLFPPPQNWPGSRKHCLPSQQNRFELVYQQSKDLQIKVSKIQFPSLGVITEDGEVYDEKQHQCIG